jgi:hypothetical protein
MFLQNAWNNILGINVEIEAVGALTRSQIFNSENFDLFMGGWQNDYPDPENSLIGLFDTGGGNNKYNCSDPDIDAKLSAAATETDNATRIGLLQDAETLIVTGLCGVAPVYQTASLYLVKSKIAGVEPNGQIDAGMPGNWCPECWFVEAMDQDGDGFSDAREAYLGTDPLDACRDDPSDAAWPLDVNNDGQVSVVGDVLNFRGRIGAMPGAPSWWQRLDFNADGQISVVGDVLLYRGLIGETCVSWTKIEPGGETICSQGTPYAFYAHPGTVNRLVVYFEGGGACWDANTCSNPGIYYDASVDETDNPENDAKGIFDLDNPANPFIDWFQVFVPYCTGDVHWGNQATTYHWGGADHTINHKGFTNVSAVLIGYRPTSRSPKSSSSQAATLAPTVRSWLRPTSTTSTPVCPSTNWAIPAQA